MTRPRRNIQRQDKRTHEIVWEGRVRPGVREDQKPSPHELLAETRADKAVRKVNPNHPKKHLLERAAAKRQSR